MLHTTVVRLVSQFFAFISCSGTIILLLSTHGDLKTAAADWVRHPTTIATCTVGIKKCCAVLANSPAESGVPMYDLKVPQGTAITGALSYGDPPWTPFDPGHKKVTVEHYDQAKDRTSFYFTMHHERKAQYYNRINWHAGEIAQYGQYLAVYIVQESLVGPNPGYDTFTLEAFAEIPV